MTLDRAALRLIAVTAEPAATADFMESIEAAVRGGATCVELRAKRTDPRLLVEITRTLVARVLVPVIVNDRADIAIAAGAAGVHVGPEDLPVAAIRAFAPAGFIIGASLGNDDELKTARGADYVGVGPVYATGSKNDAGAAIGVEEMGRLIRASGCPGVGIGGIDAWNAGAVVDAAADGIAALSAIFSTGDPERAARELRAAIAR